MKKTFFLVISLFLVLSSSCERDDICAETTTTTPKLTIVFRDAENPSVVKPVQEFNAKAIGENDFYFETPVTDTIVQIPLLTNAENTNYEFVINSFENPENDNDAEANPDQINFTYTPSTVYVSRACGYKTEFLEFSANVLGEENDTNWISSIIVEQPNDIVNEFTTQLYIYH